MIADGTPIFGLTGWKGTFAALDTSAMICIVLLAFVAIAEEKRFVKTRRSLNSQKTKQSNSALCQSKRARSLNKLGQFSIIVGFIELFESSFSFVYC